MLKRLYHRYRPLLALIAAMTAILASFAFAGPAKARSHLCIQADTTALQLLVIDSTCKRWHRLSDEGVAVMASVRRLIDDYESGLDALSTCAGEAAQELLNASLINPIDTGSKSRFKDEDEPTAQKRAICDFIAFRLRRDRLHFWLNNPSSSGSKTSSRKYASR